MDLGALVDDLWCLAKGRPTSQPMPDLMLHAIEFINTVELHVDGGQALPANQFGFYVDDLRKQLQSIP